jgi:putative transcriptional regulator
MATQKRFKSDAFEAIHESALALHGVGAIDKSNMRKFDGPCLAQIAQL